MSIKKKPSFAKHILKLLSNGILLRIEFNCRKVTQGSAKKVWWKCPKEGPRMRAAIVERKNGTGFSICAGKKIVKSNSLKTLDPKLAKGGIQLKMPIYHLKILELVPQKRFGGSVQKEGPRMGGGSNSKK